MDQIYWVHMVNTSFMHRFFSLLALVVWLGAAHHDVWLAAADFTHHHHHELPDHAEDDHHHDPAQESSHPMHLLDFSSVKLTKTSFIAAPPCIDASSHLSILDYFDAHPHLAFWENLNTFSRLRHVPSRPSADLLLLATCAQPNAPPVSVFC